MTRSGLIAAVLLVGAVAAAAVAQPYQEAIEYLQQALADPARAPVAMMALRTTGDADVLPLFVALTRSGDKKVRLFATNSMVDLAGPGAAEAPAASAAEALQERLDDDPAMAVRAEAVAQLVAMDGIQAGGLVSALSISDENVQLMAARALIAKGSPATAIATLETLTGSADENIAITARLMLLAAGDDEQLPPLRQFAADLTDEGGRTAVVGLMLGLVGELEIAAADPLARDVIAMDISVPLTIQAWRALSAVSDDVTDELADAIGQAGPMYVKLQLLKLLAARSDAPWHLQLFADSSDDEAVAALSAFELARLGGSSDAAEITQAAVELGHPVVVDYVLDQAARDIATGAAADFYVPALLGHIESVRGDAAQMAMEHVRAARATTLLANLGSPEAMAGLTELINRRYNAMVRSVAAGLMKSTNAGVCDIMRPLLTSPYSELTNDAAVTLGRLGDAEAVGRLSEIVARPERYEPALAVLACWYLLQLDGQGPAAAALLAEAVE